MAAAAYNAGPGRPRKWRDGPVLETVVWAENTKASFRPKNIRCNKSVFST